jgi:hypothetical protein
MARESTVAGKVLLASATPVMQGLAQEMRQCIQDCLECANICDQTLAYCLELGGAHARAEHVNLLRDCEETCTIAASMMGRKSRFSGQQRELCAIVCGACADTCDAIGPDDAQMIACAEACRRCQESCQALSA